MTLSTRRPRRRRHRSHRRCESCHQKTCCTGRRPARARCHGRGGRRWPCACRLHERQLEQPRLGASEARPARRVVVATTGVVSLPDCRRRRAQPSREGGWRARLVRRGSCFRTRCARAAVLRVLGILALRPMACCQLQLRARLDLPQVVSDQHPCRLAVGELQLADRVGRAGEDPEEDSFRRRHRLRLGALWLSWPHADFLCRVVPTGRELTAEPGGSQRVRSGSERYLPDRRG